MFNVQQITDRLAKMSDPQLQQYAQMHKEDPYILPLAASEFKRRQQIRTDAQGQQQPQQTVADQDLAQMQQAAQPQQMPQQQPLPEEQGIGTLPAQNLQTMADGGIAGYAEGGAVGYAAGGKAKSDWALTEDQVFAKYPERKKYFAYAIQKAREMGVDPKFAHGIFWTESRYNPSAASGTGPVGIGQNTKQTSRAFGTAAAQRTDPYKSIDASLGYMSHLSKRYGGDKAKIAIGYNQGETVLDKHLKANNGNLVPEKLAPFVRNQKRKDEPVKYLNALAPYMGVAATPTAPARTAVPAKDSLSPGEEIVYSPEGIRVSGGAAQAPSNAEKGFYEGVKEFGQSAAKTADTVWNLLPGAAGEIVYPVGRALGMSPEKADKDIRGAAQDFMDPFGKALGITQSPYYKGAPPQQLMDFIGENQTKSAEWLAKEAQKQFGLNVPVSDITNMQNTLLLGAPSVKAPKGVPYNVPTKKGVGTSPVAADMAAEAAKTQATAAAAKVEAPRLGAPTNETPGAIRVTPEGQGVLPTGEAAAANRKGIAALAEDKLVAENAARAAKEAEAVAAAARGSAGTVRGTRLTPAGKVIAGTVIAGAGAAGGERPGTSPADATQETEAALSSEPQNTAVPPGWFGGTEKAPGAKPPAAEETAAAEAPASDEQKSKFGLSDEDMLMFGLNMMMSPGGRDGSEVSKFLGDVGRSGIATLSSRKEREKEEGDRVYKAALQDYYKSLGKRQEAEASYLTTNRESDAKIKLATPAITQRFNAWLKTKMAAALGEEPSEAEKEAAMARIQSQVYGELGLTKGLPDGNTAASAGRLAFNPTTGLIE